jgi:hypothetical protein
MPCPMRPDHDHGGGVDFALLQQRLLPVTFEFFGQARDPESQSFRFVPPDANRGYAAGRMP